MPHMAHGEITRTPQQVEHAKQRARELVDASYPPRSTELRECDLVMKGGITSGVVYPLAVCELARTHRFRSIGGSSAGAIAATMAAAAEFGRDGGGFARLAALPEDVGANLSALFKPGPHTATAHAMLMAALDPAATTAGKARAVGSTVAAAHKGQIRTTVAAGAAVGLVAARGLVGRRRGAAGMLPFALVAAVPTVAATAVAAARAVAAEGRATWNGLSRQGFGICVGSAGPGAAAPRAAEDPGHLTDWLADQIDLVAGVAGPLTFRDLDDHDIKLRVMTTNLTFGKPTAFPFTDRRYFFDPVELAAYFPPRIIDHLVRASEAATAPAGAEGDAESKAPKLSPEGNPLLPFPEAKEVPIVIAARMSLSFPGLISAVPLYAVDTSRQEAADRTPVRCWFSDGGITSNFPIHFFDAMWPSRPTFALDLRGYHADHPESDVYRGSTKARQPRVRSIASPASFAASILDTMQYWADDAQAELPGYRDRIVEVHLHPDEGGMNLKMPADVIAMVAEKGRQAAEALDADFDFDEHRWARYQTSMSELQQVTDQMRALLDDAPGPGVTSYADLLGDAAARRSYRRSAAWGRKAEARTRQLVEFNPDRQPDFDDDAKPKPDPTLRIMPTY